MRIDEVLPLHKIPLTPQKVMVKNLVKNVENSRKKLQAERDRQRREKEMRRRLRIGERALMLKNNTGRLLGVIRCFGDREELRDAYGRMRGVYFYKSNQTRNSNNTLVGTGNLLTTLLNPTHP